jgi:hypothetical protein
LISFVIIHFIHLSSIESLNYYFTSSILRFDSLHYFIHSRVLINVQWLLH